MANSAAAIRLDDAIASFCEYLKPARAVTMINRAIAGATTTTDIIAAPPVEILEMFLRRKASAGAKQKLRAKRHQ